MKCANPKCENQIDLDIDMEYCNLYCYRDHLQQLEEAGEFDKVGESI